MNTIIKLSFVQPSAGWKASKQNRFKSISDVYNTLGHYGIRRFKQGILPIVSHEDKNIELPDYFDSREQWKDCPSINIIHDQSKCDSGWVRFNKFLNTFFRTIFYCYSIIINVFICESFIRNNLSD